MKPRNMAERKVRNDKIIADNALLLEYELKRGVRTLRSISEEIGLSEHRIRDVADKLGVNLEERRERVKLARWTEKNRAKIEKIKQALNEDCKLRELNLTSMARRFMCNVYLLEVALSELGIKPGTRTDCTRSATLDAGMAGDLSRYWLGRAWA